MCTHLEKFKATAKDEDVDKDDDDEQDEEEKDDEDDSERLLAKLSKRSKR